MVANRRAETSERREEERYAQDLQAGERVENQPRDSQNVYQDKIEKNARFASGRPPKGLFPRPNLLNGALAHVGSCCVISRTRPAPIRRQRPSGVNVKNTAALLELSRSLGCIELSRSLR